MNHFKNQKRFSFNPIYNALIFSVFTTSLVNPALAKVEPTYPSVPLALSGGQSSVKPNVLLFIDTSGSMKDPIVKGSREIRKDVAQSAAKAIIKKSPNLRWGLATFNDYEVRDIHPFPYIYGANIRVPISDIKDQDNPERDSHFKRLENAIDGLIFRGGTPTTSAYYELLRYYRGMYGAYPDRVGRGAHIKYDSPIQYRCQKNFIVFISDGQPQSSPWNSGNSNYERTYSSTYTDLYRNKPRNLNVYVPEGTRPLGEAFDEKGPFGHIATKLNLESSSPRRQRYGEDNVYSCTLNNTCKMYTELGMSHFARIAHTQDMISGGTDKDGKSFNEKTDKHDFSKQTITTYTIGFGADVPMLSHAAREGGGSYFNANSASDLATALDQISHDASIASANFASVTPTASLSNETGKIDSAETLSLNTENWSSQLRFYSVDSDGKVSNRYKLPTYDSANSVAVISTANGPRYLNSNTSDLNNTTFGLTDRDPNQWKKFVNWLTRRGTIDDPNSSYRVRNLQSERNNENRYLGDVLGSSLVALGMTNKAGYRLGDSSREYLAVGSNDGMVHVFKKHGAQNHEYTDVFQYIPGTAKRAGTDNETINTALKQTADKSYGGSTHVNLVNGPISWYETYASNRNTRVILTGVLGEGGRAAYALNVAGKNNAGTPIGLDADKAQWLKGHGRGGGQIDQADYFGVPLWDTSSKQIGSAHEIGETVGYMFGEPLNGRLARKGSIAAKAAKYATSGDLFYATILGSGFNPPAKGTAAGVTYPAPSIYVLDSLGLEAGNTNTNHVNPNSRPGKVEKHISTDGLANNIRTDAPRGMTAATGLDIDDDGVIDVAYAGDQNGNLYRFDFRGDISKWNVEILFQGTENQPITAAPEVFRNTRNGRVTVLFGTGSELYASDLQDKTEQRLYGIHDPLNDDPEKGADLKIKHTDYPLTPSSLHLKERTFSQNEVDGKISRKLTASGALESTHFGWYMKLNPGTLHGERVVDKPSIGGNPRKGGTVIFSTTVFNPASQEVQSSCTAEGSTQTSGFIMTLDAETGGRPLALRFLKDDLDYIGEYRPGNLSSVKIQPNGLARSSFGGSQSGRESKLGEATPPPSLNCMAAYGSSETGAGIQNFFCPGTTIKRISWREIF